MTTDETKPAGPFRVLALDGGGVMGTYTAAVLAQIEKLTKKRVADYFDLIVGTSTGGIIAVALGLGHSAEEVLALYEKNGAEIFPPARFGRLGAVGAFLRGMFRPKYSQDVLRRVFDGVVKGKRFGDSKVRLVIPAFNADNGSVHLFKTAHRTEYKEDYLLPASAVALSTSAAPTYYAAYTNLQGHCYLDGGVWANCPVMVGVLEAVYILNRPIETVSVLSIGTTNAPYHVDTWRRKGGLISWGWKGEAASLFMQAQAAGALGQARLMLGARRLLRIDNMAARGRFSMDDSTSITALRVLGENDGRTNEGEVSKLFLKEPAVPYEPCYTPQ